jgi:hypothetical protein
MHVEIIVNLGLREYRQELEHKYEEEYLKTPG